MNATRQVLHDQKINIIIVSNTQLLENPIPYKMKYIVCALAVIILAGSSCKDKSPEIKSGPEVVKENPLPEKPSDSHPTEPGKHHCPESDKCHKCRHKKKLPPGHAKKMHGAQSARDYTSGHNR
jgi:hypothetical protein